MTIGGRYLGLSRRRVIVSGAVAIAAGLSRPASAKTVSPVLVELFTSQGCSSCPPADAYLTELARQPGIVALAYHVDYWDGAAWRDPFSSPAATDRQREYARLLGLKTIYTPQMVINGRFDVVGSRRAEVAAAIGAAAQKPATIPLTLAADADRLSVRIGGGRGEGRIWLVAYDLRHETHVRGGENAGRTLENVNIVRSIDDLGRWRGVDVTLDRPRPGPGIGAAVFVQAADGAVLAVATTVGA